MVVAASTMTAVPVVFALADAVVIAERACAGVYGLFGAGVGDGALGGLGVAAVAGVGVVAGLAIGAVVEAACLEPELAVGVAVEILGAAVATEMGAPMGLSADALVSAVAHINAVQAVVARRGIARRGIRLRPHAVRFTWTRFPDEV